MRKAIAIIGGMIPIILSTSQVGCDSCMEAQQIARQEVVPWQPTQFAMR